MNKREIIELGYEASAEIVREEIMDIPAHIRPQVVDLIRRTTEATTLKVAEEVYREAYYDGNCDGSISCWDYENPYE